MVCIIHTRTYSYVLVRTTWYGMPVVKLTHILKVGVPLTVLNIFDHTSRIVRVWCSFIIVNSILHPRFEE